LASEVEGEKPLRIRKELKEIGWEAIVLPGADVRAISTAISDAVNKTEANDTTRYLISRRS
jgi:2-methylisocitrate lyase-like PEP mutase family enzyme